ncbi:C-type lectin domain-containing protein 91 [Trichinella pseudospiralis]|uniref:C-type lectin domain-containing protein 91 n=1 Tax=Trichinella pseudospiralis TaxID=6337 RepID=A0A0V1FZH8_TRIPS|nr:C-type lectin domain-containing protein 91 [Trichinella pseudospiralis]
MQNVNSLYPSVGTLATATNRKYKILYKRLAKLWRHCFFLPTSKLHSHLPRRLETMKVFRVIVFLCATFLRFPNSNFLFLTIVTASDSSIECPDGWFDYENFCYFNGKNRLSFDDAQAECVKMDATLYFPSNEDEMNEVHEHMCHPCRIWLGLNFSTEPTWLSGPAMDIQKLTWSSGDATTGHLSPLDCAAWFKPSRNAASYANWYLCSTPFYYICKKAEQSSSITDTVKVESHNVSYVQPILHDNVTNSSEENNSTDDDYINMLVFENTRFIHHKRKKSSQDIMLSSTRCLPCACFMKYLLATCFVALVLKVLNVKGEVCKYGWFQYDDACYQIQKKMSFKEAVAKCANLDGKLFFPENIRELIIINEHICSPCKAWLALTYTGKATLLYDTDANINDLPWNRGDSNKGHLKNFDCAAWNNPAGNGKPTVSWYLCSSKFVAVCKAMLITNQESTVKKTEAVDTNDDSHSEGTDDENDVSPSGADKRSNIKSFHTKSVTETTVEMHSSTALKPKATSTSATIITTHTMAPSTVSEHTHGTEQSSETTTQVEETKETVENNIIHESSTVKTVTENAKDENENIEKSEHISEETTTASEKPECSTKFLETTTLLDENSTDELTSSSTEKSAVNKTENENNNNNSRSSTEQH